MPDVKQMKKKTGSRDTAVPKHRWKAGSETSKIKLVRHM
jgi:hypothetical protein